MSDTPRTDAFIELLEQEKLTVFDALHRLQAWARGLEREVAQNKRINMDHRLSLDVIASSVVDRTEDKPDMDEMIGAAVAKLKEVP